MKIALAMIVKGKGEEQKLERALSSIAPYVDGIFITLTGPTNELTEIEKVCRSFKANISYERALWTADKKAVDWLRKFFGYEPYMKVGDKLFKFDDARNFNFNQVPKEYDWILWMDSDDVFSGGKNLRLVAEHHLEGNIEAVYFNYLYHAEFENGKIKHRVIEHLRERLVRNTGKYKWIAPIHETLIEQVPTNKTDNYDCEIIHLATEEDRSKSLNRNLKNLELSIYLTDGKDPRHIYYLAKAFYDMHTDEADNKAIPLILEHYIGGDHKSGWPEERQQAWEYLAEIYRRKQQYNNEIKSLLNAFTEPAIPTPGIFLGIALHYMMLGQNELALFWVRIATSIPDKKTTLVRNPKDIQGRTLEILYNACLNLGRVDETWGAAVKLLEMFPNDERVKSAYSFIDQLREQRDITMKVSQLADYLEKHGEGHKVKALSQAIPRIAEQNPFMIDLTNKVNPPKVWGEKEIAIICGQGFTTWSPKRLSDPKESFIGGSEEAVIKMGEALQKQGWVVTAYGDPGVDEGEYEGVKYIPYYKLNMNDTFNIVIVWRQIGFFDREIKAKKTYLWNHDIQNQLEYTPERVKKINKVFFLSKWHRDNVPSLPEEKVMITSNGI
jgi:hypothetical protein